MPKTFIQYLFNRHLDVYDYYSNDSCYLCKFQTTMFIQYEQVLEEFTDKDILDCSKCVKRKN